MIAVSVVVVAVATSIVLGVLLTLSVYLFVQLVKWLQRRLGGTVRSLWLTWLGVVIAVVGVVDLIWTQASGASELGHLGDSAALRWELATEPLMLIALGVLISIAAQILRAIQLRQLVDPIEAGPLEK